MTGLRRTALWTGIGLAVAAVGVMDACAGGTPEPNSPLLVLEQSIDLPGVDGRIDHLAYDRAGRRLFVAALGNGTVEAVDLARGRVAARIGGLAEPQGVAWLERTRELAVASGDGTVRFFAGDTLRPVAWLQVGDDADNLRVEPRTGQLLVGYGSGAIATIDPARHAVTRRLALPAHPEGFRLDGQRVYVNLPDAGAIAAGDLAAGTVTARWATGMRRLNFPMAFDPASRTLAVAFRLPARLAIVDPATGAFRQVLDTCGDSDDLFFDPPRRRLYVVCGAGRVAIYGQAPHGLAEVGRFRTRPGARTGLFVPEEDRLYVAARRSGDGEAAILVLRPEPASSPS